MLIFQPPVNFCSDENIQTIFGIKLEDFLNYRIDYNSISQTVEKVVKKIFFSAPKASKIGDRQVLVELRSQINTLRVKVAPLHSWCEFIVEQR
jgi:hypothetical protein